MATRTTEELAAIANGKKIAEWIRATYPHAIEASFNRKVECRSQHHVYHIARIIIKDGNIYFVRGSHGWSEADSWCNLETARITQYHKDVTESRNYTPLIEYIHDWGTEKGYVQMSLQPYETMFNFEV